MKKGGIWCSKYPNVFKAQIRRISSIKILKWIIVIWIIQIMWLFSLNLAIFFIVATIVTIVATIIVSKILLSSRQCRDKPNYRTEENVWSAIWQDLFYFSAVWSLFGNKRFMLDEMYPRNTSKFAIFLELQNPSNFSFNFFLISW